MSQLQQLESDVEKHAVEYSYMLNSIFSVLAFTSGVASVGTDNPKFYAWISMIFIVTLWYTILDPYVKKIKELRAANHSSVSRLVMLKRSIPFIFGWGFLAMVGWGFFDKTGFMPL